MMTCGSERSGSASWGLRAESAANSAEHEHRAEDHPLVTDRQFDDAFDHGRYSLPPKRSRRRAMAGVRVHRRGLRVLRLRRAVVVSAGAAGRPQPALRVEQEHACRHDPLAFVEAAADFHAIRQLHAERHRARFESIAGGDEHMLLEAGVHDCVARHGDHDLSRRFKGGGSIQARSEAAARIGRREADAQRARAVGERRIDEVDTRANGRRPDAGKSRCASVPTRIPGIFASGTSASTQTRDRSAIVSNVVDGSTDVPAVTPRFTTTPLLGATTVTSRLGSPLCSMASISSGAIPSTVSAFARWRSPARDT